MDELELLKQRWKDNEQKHPKLSYQQIYDMLFKRSTSIVKWIFIISIAELLFWLGLSFLTPQSTYDLLNELEVMEYLLYLNIIHYVIFAVFVYLFYKNYSSIRVTDSIKELMQSILKTRKTVRYFVIYNIAMFALSMVLLNILYIVKSDVLLAFISKEYGSAMGEDFFGYFIAVQILFGLIMIGVLILFYRIVYGILLKRLKRNYTELKRIEV